MGSVIDYIECPNCKQEATSDFYYKTGEEYVYCNNCGYNYSATILNRDKKLSEMTKEDWEIQELKNPYAAYRIKNCDSLAYQCGSLKDENQHAELLQHLLNNESIEFASISRLIDGEIVTEVIIDNGPETDSAGFTETDR